MENLKIQIKIEDNDDLKEVHGLLLELGFSTYSKESFDVWADQPKPIWLKTNAFDDMPSKIDWSLKESHGEYKEITLPQLRDLVVLKRNYVGDATHLDKIGEPWLVSGNNEFYSWADSGWMQESENVVLNYNPKPIKKPMKEYLRKNSNGTYSYIGTVRHEHVNDFMIEIPEGATKLVSHGYVHLPIMFVKPCANGYSYCYLSGIWSDTILSDIKGRDIFWSRHTHPEELPFIDDEPKITTAKGSELDYIAKIHDMRDRYDGESDEDYRYQLEHYISRKEPSLNDQYAEIEKVRQSHRTASEIADSALKHIRERAETYDQPTGERSAAKTAKAFNAITGKDITESEVWLLLQLLKDVRQWSREDYHQDSAEDCIAYAALKDESLEGGE